MHNKFFYTFSKDKKLQLILCGLVLTLIVCGMIFRLGQKQAIALKLIQEKQNLISRIPVFEAKIKEASRVVDGLILNGIITTEAQPMAVINNTLVKINEELGGKKVIAIEKSDVTVCNIAQLDICTVLRLQE